jgi:hypothetical protein
MSAIPFLLIFGSAAGLMATAFILMPLREQRKLREELLARIRREPQKIQTVYTYLDKRLRTHVSVKFRGEGRLNIPGLTGVPAAELYDEICALAPQAERVDEPAPAPAEYPDVTHSAGS